MIERLLQILIENGITEGLAWLASIGGLAAAVPLLVEFAKRSDRFPWLDQNTDTVNRTVSVLIAIVSANGISYAYDGATGDLVFTGLTAATLAKIITAIATQFGLQELMYRQVVKRIGK